MKKFLLSITLVLVSFVLFGCKDSGLTKIGIIQIESHGALDSAREGFIDALKDAGFVDGENIEINYLNPEGNSSDMQAMSRTLVRESDLILAIATPTVASIKASMESQGISVPVLFTAVTDPSSFVESNALPGGDFTGTSDMNPVDEQIELIKDLIPNVQKIGIIYTISEENSKLQADLAKARAEELGIEVEIATVNDSTDITSTARVLMGKVEAIYVPTDNNLAKNMQSLSALAIEEQIPLICGEENLVKSGGLITLGIDYYELGYLTGEMAVKVLKGETKTESLPVGFLENYAVAINEETRAALGITIPEKYKAE